MKDHEPPTIDLIADSVADPRNVPALLALAELLGVRCLFRDRHDLRNQLADDPILARFVEAPPLDEFGEHYDLLLAVENHERARSIYEYRPPQGKRLAMAVGNERKGLDRKVSRAADVMLEIPMRPQPNFSLNVAGAAAAALYQLQSSTQPKRHRRTHGRERPDLLFWQPRDAADLGSSLRAAYALGWDAASVVDTHRVWFGADRATLAQGRGAARRHKNAIRVRPLDPVAPAQTYDVGIVVGCAGVGTPVWQMKLPERVSSVLVFADAPLDLESLRALAREWQIVSVGNGGIPTDAPLRILSAITLAEVGRVVA